MTTSSVQRSTICGILSCLTIESKASATVETTNPAETTFRVPRRSARAPSSGEARDGTVSARKMTPVPEDSQPNVLCMKSGRVLSKDAKIDTLTKLPYRAASKRDELNK